MFTSAEQFYLTNNLEKAIESLKKYLKRFPNGGSALDANFFLADSYNRTDQKEKAVPYYQFILDKDKRIIAKPDSFEDVQTFFEDSE